MVKKTVGNGTLNLTNTTKVQLRSLDDFAASLDYIRGADNQYYQTPSIWSAINSPYYRVSFNTMVLLHNGYYGDTNLTIHVAGDLADLGITLTDYKKSLKWWRIVDRVKIQRKKDTTLIVQDHQVNFLHQEEVDL